MCVEVIVEDFLVSLVPPQPFEALFTKPQDRNLKKSTNFLEERILGYLPFFFYRSPGNHTHENHLKKKYQNCFWVLPSSFLTPLEAPHFFKESNFKPKNLQYLEKKIIFIFKFPPPLLQRSSGNFERNICAYGSTLSFKELYFRSQGWDL